MSSSPSDLQASLETLSEGTLQEVGYDGQEYHRYHLTLSEHFSNLALRVDFSEDAAVKGAGSSMETGHSETTAEAEDPWEKTITNLQNATTEINVLLDVLNIARNKQHMVLDPVPQEASEPKPISQIYSRKKGLCAAGSMLLAAAERLRSSHSEEGSSSKETPDFHNELLRLRQNWRIKKFSDPVIGDLSYRTAGSRYPLSAAFEVKKADDMDTDDPSTSAPASSSLDVTVHPELEGVAYIRVLCKSEREMLFTCDVNPLIPCCSIVWEEKAPWQQTLEAAQNGLFCKELFQQLAREAIEMEGSAPDNMSDTSWTVIRNNIRVALLPGIELNISLCRSSIDREEFVNTTSEESEEVGEMKFSGHNHILEHSLHQLLMERFNKNIELNLPKPTSAFLGPTKERYLAGPEAYSRSTIVDRMKSRTLLEQIVEQAQLFYMRVTVENTLDDLAVSIEDPLLVCHWNTLNAPTPACVKVTILSHGYETLYCTTLLLELSSHGIKCVCRDGRIMKLGREPSELIYFICYQVLCYYISSIQGLARSLGWETMGSNLMLGTGFTQPYTNPSVCLMTSPNSDRIVAVKCVPVSMGTVQKKVSFAHASGKDFLGNQLVSDRKWESLGGEFKEVDLERIQGRNFLNKLELIMASLTYVPS